MWNWIFENVNGIHKKKKMELQDDDEYFEFMINDFNRRLQFSLLIGIIFGVVIGALFMYGILNSF